MSASAAPLPKPVASGAVHPVDEVLAAPRLIALGIQHVLVMYAGAVAVPLIIGAAVKAPREQVAFLITCDLLACGIASLLQSVGVWRFGIRLPVIMGVTFAAVGPMVAIGSDPLLGLLGIYGATIVAGIFTILIAPFVSRLLPLFPPVVTGTIITVIGISLVGVGINWAAGGVGNPQYGRPLYLGIGFFVLLSILLITRFGRGFVRNISVLLGLIIGTIVAALLGQVDFSRMSDTAWFAVVTPFSYGIPIFDPIACATMCVVMVVVMIESLGMFLALGEICDRPLDEEDLTRGLRVDGLGTLIGGMLNTFPHSSFSQNVGLVGVTGVRSRWVCAAGGVILIILGLIPKLAAIVASVPSFVLGGAGLVMFGMVTATGIRILAGVDLEEKPNNLLIIAISIAFGMIPIVSQQFFGQLPHFLGPLLHSGILLASISAVALNAYFNGARGLATHGFDPVHAAHGVGGVESASHD
jgi:uric acid transporter